MDLVRTKQAAKKWTIRIVGGGVLLAVIGTALYTWASLKYVYSSGERVGYVQKISHKGWLCKTNEGELAMVQIAGQPAQIFTFTVPDDKLVAQIDALAGHKVALDYEEHKGVPSSCFGNTPFFITGVRKAE
jgi:hypothetical protein